MSLNLANYEAQAREAVKLFWDNREAALAKQIESGNQDAGLRGAVTTGKNMDGFLAMARSLAEANGLAPANICVQQRILTLPGFFRPTKLWDMLVMDHGKLVAALEFKSQVGPSFGNNFNNRNDAGPHSTETLRNMGESLSHLRQHPEGPAPSLL